METDMMQEYLEEKGLVKQKREENLDAFEKLEEFSLLQQEFEAKKAVLKQENEKFKEMCKMRKQIIADKLKATRERQIKTEEESKIMAEYMVQ